MSENFKVINIEEGMPTVEQARKRLDIELEAAKKAGITAIKIIHGYGSTGTGGKLKKAIRNILSLKQQNSFIKTFVAGENWSIFNEDSRKIIEICKELSKDSDLNRFNSGITLVLL